QVAALGKAMARRFGLPELKPVAPPRLEELALRAPRVKPPKALEAICSITPYDRAGHTYGKGFRDLVRALARDFGNPPDVVAFPRSDAEVAALLDWCTAERLVAIPYGGGSSVVGGVEAPADGGYRGAVSIDLMKLDNVLEVDETSRAAHIQAGMYGPALEAALKPHRLTLRHFPQSFEFSTLGGWIATRSGGHFATLYTHIDDLVESLRVVTPTGTVESFRVPGSGAGYSPDRMFIGSEGTLGIITSAWMRLQDRPTFRANSSVNFPAFLDAAQAVRAIARAGLYPANVRILDAEEAHTNGVGDGSMAVMVLGFESADHALDAWMARALECCRDHGGLVPTGGAQTTDDAAVTRQGAAGAWRNAFITMPYVRDARVMLGLIDETFETAITWERWPEFHRQVTAAVEGALREVCGGGYVTCRFTHAYPDGPAPYYSIKAPARRGSQIEQWNEVKHAASEVIVRLGATITHHHAVGRDHRPWYDRQRPEGFARAITAAKKALDPAGVLNPGVLIDPA
ncbi:MAG: FAD-binding oxidoreductase, partial [Candidatus Lambdaproteobacteria bacterium]|nr:FAD-binding oxidoreductase [Candidatus Lambdaproteobacteria bacterium]